MWLFNSFGNKVKNLVLGLGTIFSFLKKPKLSWAKLSHSWGLKLELRLRFEVKVADCNCSLKFKFDIDV